MPKSVVFVLYFPSAEKVVLYSCLINIACLIINGTLFGHFVLKECNVGSRLP